MTGFSNPGAGYYPDPAGSGALRWWDGHRWTEQLVTPQARAEAVPTGPVTAVPRPAGSAPGVPPAASSPGVSILAADVAGARRGSSLRAVAVAGLCLPLLASAVVGWRVLSPSLATSVVTQGGSARPAPAAAAKAPVVPTGSPARPAGSAVHGPRGTVVVTPAEAKQVLARFWPEHERAVVARDVAGLRRIETGAAAVYEPGALACGCLTVARPRPLVDTSFFVPRQTRYPAHFVVEAEHEMPGGWWAEVLVFTKSGPHAAWAVSLNSGFGRVQAAPLRLGAAVVDRQGYALAPSPRQHQRAKHLARRLAALWQQAKEIGRVPAQDTFATNGQTGARLARIAAYRQDEPQSNGIPGHARFYVDPRDPLVEVDDGGFDLACQPVRETMAYRAGRLTAIYQDPARSNWGSLLAPGRYERLTNHGAWQTCFLVSPDQNAPVTVLDQDVDGGVITAKRQPASSSAGRSGTSR
jgi:hypothetical protein